MFFCIIFNSAESIDFNRTLLSKEKKKNAPPLPPALFYPDYLIYSLFKYKSSDSEIFTPLT